MGTATLSLVPWLLTAVPLATAVVAARRVVSLLGVEDVRRLRGFGALRVDVLDAGAGFTGTYTLVTLAVALLVQTPQVHPSLVGSVLGGFVLSVAAFALSVVLEFRGDVGTVAPDLAAAWHDLVPRFVRRAVRPASSGVACSLGAGLLLALLVVVLHLGRIGRLYDTLGAGLVGGIVSGLAQVALLPNLGMWALAWVAGPGFGIGDGSAITWTTSDPGLLPLVPVLGALPDPGPLPSGLWLAVLVPVAIGAVVGWRSLRAVSRLSTWQIKAETSATACLLCALVLTLAVALAGGAAGAARLGSVGANPWAVGGALLGGCCSARRWWSARHTCAPGGAEIATDGRRRGPCRAGRSGGVARLIRLSDGAPHLPVAPRGCGPARPGTALSPQRCWLRRGSPGRS